MYICDEDDADIYGCVTQMTQMTQMTNIYIYIYICIIFGLFVIFVYIYIYMYLRIYEYTDNILIFRNVRMLEVCECPYVELANVRTYREMYEYTEVTKMTQARCPPQEQNTSRIYV